MATSGLEDRMFGEGELRRVHILKMFRNYDVDPNMHPDGSMEANRIERLVGDPTISFDTIRRSAQMTARNGFTLTEIQHMSQAQMPVTMSDPGRYLDQSFSYDGEAGEFTDGGIELPESNPMGPDRLGFDASTLEAEAEEEQPYEILEDEGSVEDQLISPEQSVPTLLPEEEQAETEVSGTASGTPSSAGGGM